MLLAGDWQLSDCPFSDTADTKMARVDRAMLRSPACSAPQAARTSHSTGQIVFANLSLRASEQVEFAGQLGR
jgi:hypothetical protein